MFHYIFHSIQNRIRKILGMVYKHGHFTFPVVEKNAAATDKGEILDNVNMALDVRGVTAGGKSGRQ